MNVASKELCQELFELSGWIADSWVWARHEKTNEYRVQWLQDLNTGYYWVQDTTAYDLGYLLRKLPPEYQLVLDSNPLGERKYWFETHVGEGSAMNWSDTPEDAAAKLAIELFKQGMLKK